ncbi:hypothetical protein KCP75_01835 [Salmonella enterica subsp. enterica]|nr:hypothetical protein KCP75_01835 [Salmonella enterica subsp. enterica]
MKCSSAIAGHAISRLTICAVITMLIAVAVNVRVREPLTSLDRGESTMTISSGYRHDCRVGLTII